MPNFGANVPRPGTPLDEHPGGARRARQLGRADAISTDQLDLTARFSTGAVAHTLVTGLELARQTSDISTATATPSTPTTAGSRRPRSSTPTRTRPCRYEPVASHQNTDGALRCASTPPIRWGSGRYVDLIAGCALRSLLRRLRPAHRATSGALLHLTELNRLGSPRAALVFKPTPTADATTSRTAPPSILRPKRSP